LDKVLCYAPDCGVNIVPIVTKNDTHIVFEPAHYALPCHAPVVHKNAGDLAPIPSGKKKMLALTSISYL